MFGFQAWSLTPELAARSGVPPSEKGVAIIGVDQITMGDQETGGAALFGQGRVHVGERVAGLDTALERPFQRGAALGLDREEPGPAGEHAECDGLLLNVPNVEKNAKAAAKKARKEQMEQ